MKQDSYGRWFMEGNEDTPNDLRCMKCGEIPYKQGNPYGTYIFTFNRGDDPHSTAGFALCDPCALKVWEFITPEMAEQPSYIAKKDQHLASRGKFVEHWNEKCRHFEDWEMLLEE